MFSDTNILRKKCNLTSRQRKKEKIEEKKGLKQNLLLFFTLQSEAVVEEIPVAVRAL